MMKKIILIVLTTVLLITGSALAETAVQPDQPKAMEQQGSGIIDWISGGWNTVVSTIESGWNTVSDALASGWNTVAGSVSSGWNTVAETVESGISTVTKSVTETEWFHTVENFVTKNSATVSEAVVQSWNTIRQGAFDIGTVTFEKLEEACRNILEWLNKNNPREKEEVTEALNQIMLELRAAYQNTIQ